MAGVIVKGFSKNMRNTTFFTLFLILRKLTYITLGKLDAFIGRKNKLVILCYHAIDETDWLFATQMEDLERQMSFMLMNYVPIRLSEVYSILSGNVKLKKPSFVVTYDDGYKDILKTRELFSRLGIYPTVFVFSDAKKVDRNLLGNSKKLLSGKDLETLLKYGWEIGSHGEAHKKLTNVEIEELKGEVFNSKNKIAKKVKSEVEFFSYPFGSYSDAAVHAVRNAGYKLGVSMDDEEITIKTNPYILPRVGVNNSQSFEEFKYLASPTVIWLRGLIKKTFLGHYI